MVYQLESPDINTVINYCKDLCANDNDAADHMKVFCIEHGLI